MARREPEVISGNRQPRGLDELGKPSNTLPRPGLDPVEQAEYAVSTLRTQRLQNPKEIPTHIRIFTSRYRLGRVQVTSPANRVDHKTGVVEPVRPIAAKFDNYTLRVDTRKDEGVTIVHRFEGCPPDCRLHEKPFDAHPNYGLGRDFWDAALAMQVAKVKTAEQLVAVIKGDKELTDRVLELLAEDDHVVGPPAGEQATT